MQVELTTDLDDDQTAIFRVKPMVITRVSHCECLSHHVSHTTCLTLNASLTVCLSRLGLFVDFVLLLFRSE